MNGGGPSKCIKKGFHNNLDWNPELSGGTEQILIAPDLWSPIDDVSPDGTKLRKHVFSPSGWGCAVK